MLDMRFGSSISLNDFNMHTTKKYLNINHKYVIFLDLHYIFGYKNMDIV